MKVNRALAEVLGLDAEQLASAEGAQVLSGNALPDARGTRRTPRDETERGGTLLDDVAGGRSP